MAGDAAPAIKPVSAQEQYQYAAAALRRNLFADVQRIAEAFKRTGREFSEGRFRSLAALARVNVQREAERFVKTYPGVLPAEIYRETRSWNSAPFRFTVIVETVNRSTGVRAETGFTISSDWSLSFAEWTDAAKRALERYRERYGYDAIGITLVDARRNPSQRTTEE